MPTERAQPKSRIRRPQRRERARAARLLGLPGAGPALVIWVVFALLCTLVSIWAREQPLVAPGRVMNQTATVRVRFVQEDKAATARRRDDARQFAPRVYTAEAGELQEILVSIGNLPKTLTGAERVEDVDPEIRARFGLTPERLAAVHAEGARPEWEARARRLADLLLQMPLVDQITFQREQQSVNKLIKLVVGGQVVLASSSEVVNLEDPARLREAVESVVQRAGFTGPVAGAVVSRLLHQPRPTFTFSAAETERERVQAAEAVRPVEVVREQGQVIFTRGEVLKPDAFELYRAELRAFRDTERWFWLRRASIAGAVTAVSLALAGYVAIFAPRIRQSPRRAGGVAALLAGALGLACWATVADPRLTALSAIAPTIFVSIILIIAYDRRLALGFGALHGLLVAAALDQPIGIYALIITGIGVAVWLLKDIRDRTSLVRVSVIEALALAAGTVVVALIDRPLNPDSLRQTLIDAGLAGFGGLLAGGVVVFILPSIEKWFGITTSMTLVELRDPKHPLLRQLQQRAPGTYNHSLNVANLAEAAAESIGASGLLAFVGALYHDVGKMNKPDYFVENQTPGINRHDRLSPAMSLLVIVGHVKDGMELARDYNIPQPLHHFIEAHHGTTLVEYFFHRARQLAAGGSAANGNSHGDQAGMPEEIEYRYPGPRPQTKEVAIVMICDAVESAVRAMANPTPARIDAVVRALATKRLMDGQFDDCDLTLRELNTVVETVSKTLTAIYHGRVAYPEAREPEPAPAETRTGPAAGAVGSAGAIPGADRLEEAEQAPRTIQA